jgi:hypothetical protein
VFLFTHSWAQQSSSQQSSSQQSSAQSPDNPKDLLPRVRQTVVDTVTRLPKYVCTETIDRSRFEPESGPFVPGSNHRLPACDDVIAKVHGRRWKRRLVSSDRVRLEVAVSHDMPNVEDEMYSWPGEHRFSDRSLFQLVHDGALSTGSFSSILAAIFGSRAARFSYNGDKSIAGRSLLAFGFDIPLGNSNFMYLYGNGPEQQSAVPYDGTVFVDPQTADPVQLTIRSGELPSETGACELTQILEYGRVSLNGSSFLLPTEARVSVIHNDGTEAENRIHYSSCQEFLGESEVRFDPERETRPVPKQDRAAAVPSALAPGLSFKLVFTEPIDTATAAAGDVIKGTLKEAMRDRSTMVIVPEGTAVSGRILCIRRFYPRTPAAEKRSARTREPYLQVDVRLEKMVIAGTPRPLHAVLETDARKAVKFTGPFTVRVDLGAQERSADRAPDSDVATFEFWEDRPDFVVKAGFESNWVSVVP